MTTTTPTPEIAENGKPIFQTIWQGDSRERLTNPKLTGRVNCIITDPPFGVDNKSNMAVTKHGQDYARKIANDENPEVAIKTFKEVMDVLCPQTSDDCDMYIFTAHQVLEEWLGVGRWLHEAHGFKRNALLVWEKDGPGMGDLEGWGMGHEIIIFLKKGRVPRYADRRNGVLHVPQLRPNQLIHPHEKPTALLEMLIKHSTQPGDLVVDPFGGSGSLVRACRKTRRSGIAVEYDEENFKMAMDKFKAEAGGLF
ncbi:site-specific DNA-methyltransferase [Streptomyces wedmorensis]|uniref:DNA-methyltransferase n=1 Tax=Streptomyces wedmorensis TaxID=43759 RepID=UPI003447AE29